MQQFMSAQGECVSYQFAAAYIPMRLRNQPNRRVRCAVAAIAVTLHDLEEKAVVHRSRVGLKERAILIGVIENVQTSQFVDLFQREVGPCGKIFVVVLSGFEAS